VAGVCVTRRGRHGGERLIRETPAPQWGRFRGERTAALLTAVAVLSACNSPAWSPDGRTIAFVRANYEGFALYTISADGSGSPIPLPGAGWAQDRPAWSPDGSRVAFETLSGAGDEIASVTADGFDFKVHVADATGYLGAPAWSPDGRSLLFSRASPRGAHTRIFIVSEDGSIGRFIPEAQSPANSGYWDRDPAWSWAD
jgi:Tol biopolymer transport system component